ncbi:MAG: DUF4185 domain-containing protein [Dysgonamonadaceae bacterium]|jgi:hypothetical protein|nr:DUF4185 domain-containing protein [Dysgonamonadaceae bacterium]
MKKHVLIFALVSVLFSLSSCEDTDQQKETNDRSFIEIVYKSHADTLFLLWELTGTAPDFDQYQIEVGKSKEKVQTAGKDKGECFFTHVPYDRPVSVSVSLVENDKAIKTNSISATIDGLDKTIARILIPDQGGVTAGDGIFSIVLPDGRSFFSMQDSYIGTVINGKMPESSNRKMYRNTYFVYDHASGTVTLVWPGSNSNASAAAIPTDGSKWYWPGHGYTDGDKLYKFCSLMYMAGEGAWGFAVERVNVLTYQLPGLQLIDDRPIPYPGADRTYEAVLKDGDYVYIYAGVSIQGGLDPKVDVMVARAAPNNPYAGWEYYNGSGWSGDPADAVRMEGLSSVPVSSLSVFKLGDKYVLLTEHQALWVGDIYTFISDTPYGPWRNKKTVFTAHEPAILYTYNATAHPQFQKDGMILVAYNVNLNDSDLNGDGVVDWRDIYVDVSAYRPRFFWVDIDTILN